MKYYTLNYAVDTDETGDAYPQISDDSPACLEGRKGSMRNLDAYRLTSFVPDLDYYELNKDAKLTDLMSGGVPAGVSGGVVKGFVVNEKLKNIFQMYNLDSYYFYPAVVKEKKVFHRNYYLMHVVSDQSDYIDFNKSEFYKQKFVTNLGDVKVMSKSDYDEKTKEFWKESMVISIEPTKLVLSNEFDKKLDLFVAGLANFDVIISERLREHLLNEKITGIEIKESVVSVG